MNFINLKFLENLNISIRLNIASESDLKLIEELSSYSSNKFQNFSCFNLFGKIFDYCLANRYKLSTLFKEEQSKNKFLETFNPETLLERENGNDGHSLAIFLELNKNEKDFKKWKGKKKFFQTITNSDEFQLDKSMQYIAEIYNILEQKEYFINYFLSCIEEDTFIHKLIQEEKVYIEIPFNKSLIWKFINETSKRGFFFHPSNSTTIWEYLCKIMLKEDFNVDLAKVTWNNKSVSYCNYHTILQNEGDISLKKALNYSPYFEDGNLKDEIKLILKDYQEMVKVKDFELPKFFNKEEFIQYRDILLIKENIKFDKEIIEKKEILNILIGFEEENESKPFLRKLNVKQAPLYILEQKFKRLKMIEEPKINVTLEQINNELNAYCESFNIRKIEKIPKISKQEMINHLNSINDFQEMKSEFLFPFCFIFICQQEIEKSNMEHLFHIYSDYEYLFDLSLEMKYFNSMFFTKKFLKTTPDNYYILNNQEKRDSRIECLLYIVNYLFYSDMKKKEEINSKENGTNNIIIDSIVKEDCAIINKILLLFYLENKNQEISIIFQEIISKIKTYELFCEIYNENFLVRNSFISSGTYRLSNLNKILHNYFNTKTFNCYLNSISVFFYQKFDELKNTQDKFMKFLLFSCIIPQKNYTLYKKLKRYFVFPDEKISQTEKIFINRTILSMIFITKIKYEFFHKCFESEKEHNDLDKIIGLLSLKRKVGEQLKNEEEALIKEWIKRKKKKKGNFLYKYFEIIKSIPQNKLLLKFYKENSKPTHNNQEKVLICQIDKNNLDNTVNKLSNYIFKGIIFEDKNKNIQTYICLNENSKTRLKEDVLNKKIEEKQKIFAVFIKKPKKDYINKVCQIFIENFNLFSMEYFPIFLDFISENPSVLFNEELTKTLIIYTKSNRKIANAFFKFLPLTFTKMRKENSNDFKEIVNKIKEISKEIQTEGIFFKLFQEKLPKMD